MNLSATAFFSLLFACGFATLHNSKSAFAQMSGKKIVDRMDTDGDGKVSRKEFRGRQLRFEDIDLNQDGFATSEEFDDAMRKVRAKKAG